MGLPVDAIINAESGGNPNSKNPNSSASGLGNFIDSTWLDTIKAHRPDLAQGKSDADLLALKTNPDLSREMTGAYAGDNQAALARAGHPVTDGNTYLAHFAGPSGAISVLNADPATPVASVLPSAVSANPFLKGMTAGDLRAWADRKAGGTPPSAPAASASPANAIPPPSPPILPQAQRPQMQAQWSPSAPPQQAPLQSFAPLMPLGQIPAPPPPMFAPLNPILSLPRLRAQFPLFPTGNA